MDVHIESLNKSFGKAPALQNVSLTIRSGEFTTLLGPSGCGKTTLLRLIAGLEAPDSGDIRFGEETIFSAAKRIHKPVHKRGLGMVFQDFALWPHMTVFENVAFGLRAAGPTAGLKDKVQEAIRLVRLAGFEQRRPSQLSGGQQQRVAFARAIVTEPQLILFDEPLSALDAVLREEMKAELMALVRALGMTALYVTHDQSEAMSMSDRIIVMRGGKILQAAAPEHIYRAPADPFVARFVGRSNWIDGELEMFRPEHVRWTGTAHDRSWKGKVIHTGYMGERYEIHIEVEAHGVWTAYHQERLPVGSPVTVYVSPHHIHGMNKKEDIAV